MVGIRQAVIENRWSDAAKALSSAFSELERDRQITLVQIFHLFVLEELRELYGSKEAFLNDFEKYLNNQQDDYPWIVHFLDSQEVIRNVQYDSKIKRLEAAALLAEAVWDMITGVQVKVWSASDPEDFAKWKVGENVKGLDENTASVEAGREMWSYIYKVIKAEPSFKGLNESRIYEDRPKMKVFDNMFS
jgi:hypothetical protein